MAKSKRSPRRPQPRHKTRRQPSRHDRRKRLYQRKPERKKTERARFPLVGLFASLVAILQSAMDCRIAFRLPILVAGMLFAEGRRTVASWFAAAGVRDDWDQFYDCLISIGRQPTKMAAALLEIVSKKFAPGAEGRIVVAIDDTPTKRSGPRVEGAGVHHHPTPGPADGQWLYGHVWVALAWLCEHPLWGTIAMPLRSLLYVREVDVPKLADARGGWEFKTKHQLAAELMAWFVNTLRSLGVNSVIWAVVDGAYAARPFLTPVGKLGVVVVSRLRKDARLWNLPPKRDKRQRGRPPVYGPDRISLAKRAGQLRGWQWITYRSRGVNITCEYKTFEATSRLVGGVIRVVLLRDEDRWVAYFCTNPKAEVREILEAVASRWAIEEHFHDIKEVWGAGEQQVRNVWSNIACWNLNQWISTLVEWCAWDQPQVTLSDRSERSWDNPNRRPSHADRRRWIAHQCLENELSSVLGDPPDSKKFRDLAESLFRICV